MQHKREWKIVHRPGRYRFPPGGPIRRTGGATPASGVYPFLRYIRIPSRGPDPPGVLSATGLTTRNSAIPIPVGREVAWARAPDHPARATNEGILIGVMKNAGAAGRRAPLPRETAATAGWNRRSMAPAFLDERSPGWDAAAICD